MKTVSKLSLLTVMLALAAACNEKVSPELKDGSATVTTGGSGSGGGPTIVPNTYYFKIENTSPVLLNYKLHKTGSGNATTKCEVSNSNALSSDRYRSNQSANDITCYLEAEELSLYAGGFSWEISASPNTCDFVGYRPYSYYNRQPGDSSSSYTTFKCMSETTTNAVLEGQVGTANDTAIGNALCGQTVSNDSLLPAGTRRPFIFENDEDLCTYNYQDGDKEKCDIGVITVTDVQVTHTEGTPSTVKTESTTRTIRCGGAPKNCVKGPIRDLSQLDNSTRGWIVHTAEYDKTFKKEYEYEAPIETQRYYNISLVNYRRDLASTLIDYGNSSHDYSSDPTVPYANTYSDAYKNASSTVRRLFEPSLVEQYAQNLSNDGSKMIDDNRATVGSYWNTVSNISDQRIARPLAAEPFVGLRNYYTNPFYTFYCLDTAQDIKARIRMVVRDWDRVFPTGSNLELLTDVGLIDSFGNVTARQDVPLVQEIAGDPDWINDFNDRYDWEDLISMERLNGTPLIYRPVPVGAYTQGYFNPYLFPNESSEQ